VVVEWIFDWPGIGTLFARTLIPTGITSTYSTIESVLFLDPGTVAATTMMFAALFLIIDWSAMAIARSVDPRLVG
jgi:ABC-type dipeptide/oligopeptide/nickel transport system permease component